MTRKVTIQGVAGCYHHAAAASYFSNDTVEAVPCKTFEEMFETLDNDASLLGIVAIENTIAGSLLSNHELLRRSNLTIVGEHKMRISHVAAALDGDNWDTLTQVNSHPIALMQCEKFLHRHPHLRVVEKFDTAGAAMEIARDELKGHLAICSEFSANLYGLKVLEKGIETNKRNFTRFLILADPVMAPELRPRPELINKASLVFNVPHTTGALSKVLTILSFYDINMTKLQSMPILGREWEYRFYIDVTFDSYVRYRQALEAVKPLIGDLKILGEYKQCENEV